MHSGSSVPARLSGEGGLLVTDAVSPDISPALTDTHLELSDLERGFSPSTSLRRPGGSRVSICANEFPGQGAPKPQPICLCFCCCPLHRWQRGKAGERGGDKPGAWLSACHPLAHQSPHPQCGTQMHGQSLDRQGHTLSLGIQTRGGNHSSQ